MRMLLNLKNWWNSISPDKRAKIVAELESVFHTFIAAFLIQMAIDIQAMHFIIPLDMVALSAIIFAAFRAGVKALMQLFVIWIRTKFNKVT